MEVGVVNTLNTGVSTSFKMPAGSAEAQLVECMPMQVSWPLGSVVPALRLCRQGESEIQGYPQLLMSSRSVWDA